MKYVDEKKSLHIKKTNRQRRCGVFVIFYTTPTICISLPLILFHVWEIIFKKFKVAYDSVVTCTFTSLFSK